MAQRKLEWRDGEMPLAELERVHVSSRPELQVYIHDPFFYLFAKRAMDVVFSSIALVVLLPFLLVVALIIYIDIDDPHGSPIFVQDRVGENGRVFRFLKFRSMVVDAEERLGDLQSKNEMDGPVFKIRDDPRVTRFGRFIRRTSIDELPQLFNIIKGDMSIVGPRPPLLEEVEQYTPEQMHRLDVKPGLTCYWQCSGRSNLSFEKWMELDLKYICERSLWTDFKIILKTVPTVLTGRGAY